MDRLITYDRRTLLAGSLVAGSAAVATTRFAFAQDSTPEASREAETGTDEDSTEVRKEFGQRQLDRLTTALSSVQTDLDAVRNQIDTTTIDAITVQVSDLIAKAQSSLDAGSTDDIGRTAFAAQSSIEAARSLIRAHITYPGLPSEQVRTSHMLARTFEEIEDVNAAIVDSGNEVDTSFFTSTAESTYTTAYDLYAGSAWAQARETGRGASNLITAAAILATDVEFSFGGGGFSDRRHIPAISGGSTGGKMPDIEFWIEAISSEGDSPDDSTPVEVPEPMFGT